MHRNFAVLIPTRNRPEKVAKLLSSIASSNRKPHQVIIVASGDDIWPTIAYFSNSLPITYKHTTSRGQIAQKKIGISLMIPTAEWCLFLDDDLLLTPNTLDNAFEVVSSNTTSEVIGVGLSLPSTTRARNANWILRITADIFGIKSNPPGTVFRNGHASSYLEQEKVVQTQWLNGASLWKSEYLATYGKGLPSTGYAACEDLIFSYPLSKLGKLIYAPNAKLQFQENELSDFDSVGVMEAAAYWRFYFVCTNKELSKLLFSFSQIGRSLFAFTRTKERKFCFILESIRIETRILSSILKKRDPKELLNRLVN
jgi:glycosyltransferase involved in cell wall biosynthesis